MPKCRRLVAAACFWGLASVADCVRGSLEDWISDASLAGHAPVASWRDAWLSDWEVQLDRTTYSLHAFVLARASSFFAGSVRMADQGGKLCSNLTNLLPTSCYPVFEHALDWIYSTNRSSFDVPASAAFLLLKVADLLGIGDLAREMNERIAEATADDAVGLLKQYLSFHIPGTDEGREVSAARTAMLRLIIPSFQALLFKFDPDFLEAMTACSTDIIVEILSADDLGVCNEDVVWAFVTHRMSAHLSTEHPLSDDRDSKTVVESKLLDDVEGESAEKFELLAERALVELQALWRCVRLQYLSLESLKLAEYMARGLRVSELQADVFEALALRTEGLDVKAARGMRPPGVAPALSNELDLCFYHFGGNASGPQISKQKRIGDMVARIDVYALGDQRYAGQFATMYFRVVPQRSWPDGWRFDDIALDLTWFRWTSGPVADRHHRVHLEPEDFDEENPALGDLMLKVSELPHLASTDGFMFVRASIARESLGATVLVH